MVTDEQTREALAVIVKKTEQKFGGPSLAEFANDPPIRKHYAVAEAILREFDVTPHIEDTGAAANCHLCVGAGGYEDHDGEWIECSCQRKPQEWIPDMPKGERVGYSEGSRLPEPQGEPSDAQVGAAMNAVVTYYEEQGHVTTPESVDFQALRAGLRAAGVVGQTKSTPVDHEH